MFEESGPALLEVDLSVIQTFSLFTAQAVLEGRIGHLHGLAGQMEKDHPALAGALHAMVGKYELQRLTELFADERKHTLES